MIQLSRLQKWDETMEELNKIKRLNESSKHTEKTRYMIMSKKKCIS
jgi:hypothetical protein